MKHDSDEEAEPLIEPTEDEKRNGWTAETLTEYHGTVARNIQARYFGQPYGDADLDEEMRRQKQAKRVRCESIGARSPLDW